MRDRNRIDYNRKFNDRKIIEETKQIFEPVDSQQVKETIEEVATENTDNMSKLQEAKVVIKDNQSLNLRENKDVTSSVIKTLSNNEKVIIDTIYPDWYHVFTESGAEGYVMAQYIEMI